MVNVEAIERIDALYGPFSAIYPGNSIGTTLIVTERKPRGLEASASIKLQPAGLSTSTAPTRAMAASSCRRALPRAWIPALWYAGSVQHQDSQGHPMGYANAVRGATSGAFATPTTGTPVTGIATTATPGARARHLWRHRHATTACRTPSTCAWATTFRPRRRSKGRVPVAQRQHRAHHATYLRDAAGNPVWSGVVNDGVNQLQRGGQRFCPQPARRTPPPTRRHLEDQARQGLERLRDADRLPDAQRCQPARPIWRSPWPTWAARAP
jgi:iron complex outermembrane receptor protein